MGSENGGIVVNLGMDGVACQTARRLPVEKNSTFDLRLRGAGLNVELAGEVVWVGATQKKVGIRFKSPSSEVRKEIADWIAREAQLFGPVGLEDESPTNAIPAMPAMPGLSPTGGNSISHPLSAAFDRSRTNSVEPLPSEEDDAAEERLPTPLNSADAKFRPTPLPESVSPIQQRNLPAEKLDERFQVRNADSSALPREFRVERPPQNDALFEPLPIEKPYQFPTYNSSPVVPSEQARPPAREELPQPSVEHPGKSESRKAEEIQPSLVKPPAANSSPIVFPERAVQPLGAELRKAKETAPTSAQSPTGKASPVALSAKTMSPAREGVPPAAAKPAVKSEPSATEKNATIPPEQASARAANSPESRAAERWIPPALLDVWRRGDRQQKWVLAGLGATCLGSFVLIVVLSVARLAASSGRSAESGPPPATSSAVTVVTESETLPEPPEPVATDPDEPTPPPTSLFAYLVDKFLGVNHAMPEWMGRRAVAIDPAHVRVQVWTSKSSGYYYCTDNEFYKTVQPGSFMTQRDALQNGYQPKLGQFCN